MKHKLAVFASGHGTNFTAINDAIHSGQIPATIELVVCDQPNAAVIDRAARAGIDTLVVSRNDYPSKAAFEQVIADACRAHEVAYIFLAGYMRILGKVMLEAYPHRIINIHPSLLPSFTGLDAIGQAFNKGVKMTGITIHYVDEGMDTGPIIAQAAVPVEDDDTIETLEARIHETEHKLYPATIAKMLSE
ncbi:phosphoribosylglycinamide formyltransferase [Sporolactobacillus terrae]|uniref:Phosphoribosylglycinamide formyltransferase n=1 Tax=Sporolactobacillus terrae TaxID=269673 RepID=A0ABX5Q9Z9_9BACL|nr:phosphoribosylglycinamide formyltransferase [Sporolactobacillus terrae]QAA23444.1 phosphoribosylglycinamide formyltransferase [Sporolactobacillus terrae]QAA26414.1 phosphoribosylglycinamide formyltransferase [Sporolactobacillus terrae]UAK15508.1 phosphoribosylglycinamide formyltransferase [Sporolactobacillus terrae]